MKKVASWFRNLSRVGRVSVVSAVLVGGFAAASATNQPPIVQSVTPVEATTVKQPVVTTKTKTVTAPIAFKKESVTSSAVEVGTSYVRTAGRKGMLTTTYTITLTDGVETSRSPSVATTKKPVSEITVIGTKPKPQLKPSNCDPNYSGCVPNVSYDLDCGDIGVSINVIGSDPHGFDGDGDGYGCESY